eukprot:9532722-Alexandrium_andersonii.AAC.1
MPLLQHIAHGPATLQRMRLVSIWALECWAILQWNDGAGHGEADVTCDVARAVDVASLEARQDVAEVSEANRLAA